MGGEIVYTFQDYSKEKSNARFNIQTVTAANFDATVAALATFQAALIALQEEDCLQAARMVATNDSLSRQPAANKASQRETKWLLLCEDVTLHSLFRHEIPIAKLSLLANNSDELVLASGPGATFKSSFESLIKSPAGNDVSLVSVKHVGKRT